MTGYSVVIEGDPETGYSAWSPDLAGCVAAAADYTECVDLMAEALLAHVQGMREDGQEVPEPTAVGAVVLPAA